MLQYLCLFLALAQAVPIPDESRESFYRVPAYRFQRRYEYPVKLVQYKTRAIQPAVRFGLSKVVDVATPVVKAAAAPVEAPLPVVVQNIETKTAEQLTPFVHEETAKHDDTPTYIKKEYHPDTKSATYVADMYRVDDDDDDKTTYIKKEYVPDTKSSAYIADMYRVGDDKTTYIKKEYVPATKSAAYIADMYRARDDDDDDKTTYIRKEYVPATKSAAYIADMYRIGDDDDDDKTTYIRKEYQPATYSYKATVPDMYRTKYLVKNYQPATKSAAYTYKTVVPSMYSVVDNDAYKAMYLKKEYQPATYTYKAADPSMYRFIDNDAYKAMYFRKEYQPVIKSAVYRSNIPDMYRQGYTSTFYGRNPAYSFRRGDDDDDEGFEAEDSDD